MSMLYDLGESYHRQPRICSMVGGVCKTVLTLPKGKCRDILIIVLFHGHTSTRWGKGDIIEGTPFTLICELLCPRMAAKLLRGFCLPVRVPEVF